MGELVTTHGIRGWLKLHPYNPQTESLASLKRVCLEKGGRSAEFFVEACKAFKRDFLLKLRGADTIAEAEPWVGSVVLVDESDLEPLKPGEYYYHQIIGFDVFDREGRWLGKVARIWAKGGGDLYVLEGAEKEYLIPATAEIVDKVDLAERKILVQPPPGLLDL
ncbi:MAG TPA: ribosome maturation factor RimM [Candidatus Acidoferrales bacterium]|nr:ribosome maturation factor RimM [Candidatus Acidoferrales bacterium]